jgi:hypothetical protein
MKTTLLLPFLLLFSALNAQTLQLIDSLQFSQAQIWGVCSDDGDSLCVTTTFTPATRPHIYMRKVDYWNINGQSALKQLTFDSDFTSISNMTDHKHIILHNEIFVTFSTQGDQQLFLFKTDINGNRIGNIVPVTLGPGGPTNDMILTTDSMYIYVLHFAPPNQHHVYKYDTDLNFISGLTTTTNGHNNIGGAILHNNEFHMFTGSIFGFNSNLTLTTWDTLWAPLSTQNILSATNGDGNWFATGIAHDPWSGCWMIAESHIEPPTTINNEHIDVLLYDASWNLIERIHATPSASFRPHFVFKYGRLYMTYDKQGGFVGMKVYNLLTGSIGESQSMVVNIRPNPAIDQVLISVAERGVYVVEVFNLSGQCILTQSTTAENEIHLNVEMLAEGVYTVRIGNGNLTYTGKLVIEG